MCLSAVWLFVALVHRPLSVLSVRWCLLKCVWHTVLTRCLPTYMALELPCIGVLKQLPWQTRRGLLMSVGILMMIVWVFLALRWRMPRLKMGGETVATVVECRDCLHVLLNLLMLICLAVVPRDLCILNMTMLLLSPVTVVMLPGKLARGSFPVGGSLDP